MFITPGTVFSQLFWFSLCFAWIIFVISRVFLRKIKHITFEREQLIHSLQNQIATLLKQSSEINIQTNVLEQTMREAIAKARHDFMQQDLFVLLQSKGKIEQNYIDKQNIIAKNIIMQEQKLMQKIKKTMPDLLQNINL